MQPRILLKFLATFLNPQTLLLNYKGSCVFFWLFLPLGNLSASVSPPSFSATPLVLTFKEAMDRVKKHESIEVLRQQSQSLMEKSFLEGSWKEPSFQLEARNFPISTLRSHDSPMTGLRVQVSQSIPLNSKYEHLKKAAQVLSNSVKHEALDREEKLKKSLWETLIVKRKIEQEQGIIKENLRWIAKMLKISKELYANGKTSQQALFDLQIRHSEIEIALRQRESQLSQMKDRLSYLAGSAHLDEKTIPWGFLDRTLQEGSKKKKETYSQKGLLQKNFQGMNHEEISLKERWHQKDHHLKASLLNRLPDITFSLNYIRRSHRDQDSGEKSDDFIGVQLSFPLPFSPQRSHSYRQSLHDKASLTQRLKMYERLKARDVSLLQKEITLMEQEIGILVKKTIPFTKSLRSITAKSYGNGNSDYIELLQSELKLQDKLLKKIKLQAQKDIKKLTLMYLQGEPLYESSETFINKPSK